MIERGGKGTNKPGVLTLQEFRILKKVEKIGSAPTAYSLKSQGISGSSAYAVVDILVRKGLLEKGHLGQIRLTAQTSTEMKELVEVTREPYTYSGDKSIRIRTIGGGRVELVEPESEGKTDAVPAGTWAWRRAKRGVPLRLILTSPTGAWAVVRIKPVANQDSFG